MKKILLGGVILSMTLNGCDGKKVAASTAETDTTTVVEEVVSAEADQIKLIKVKGEKIGFTIQIPEGAKELQNTEYSWTHSLMLNQWDEINVQVMVVAGEIPSLKEAVDYTSSFGGKKGAKEQKVVGSNFFVQKEPIGTVMQEIWLFAKTPKGEFIAVKCTAPPSQETVCLAIVNSLKAI